MLGSTEAEAREKRRDLEDSVDPDLRWRMLAHTAGLDLGRIDPTQPLSEEVAATANGSTFAQTIVGEALRSQRPFGEVAGVITGLPGGLDFTGTPEQLADLIEEWVGRGGSDGFTLQPATLPDSLELFVDHVVPLLQRRGLHRRDYTGRTLREHLGLARPGLTDPGLVTGRLGGDDDLVGPSPVRVPADQGADAVGPADHFITSDSQPDMPAPLIRQLRSDVRVSD